MERRRRKREQEKAEWDGMKRYGKMKRERVERD